MKRKNEREEKKGFKDFLIINYLNFTNRIKFSFKI